MPANLLAVPLGALALMSNLGALLCGHWFPFATMLFNQSAWFFMSAMTWVSEAFVKIPGTFFYVPEISWFTVVVFYVAVVIPFSGWLRTRVRIVFVVAAALCLGAFYFWQWQSTHDETHLTVLPLNGSHAIYVDAPGAANDWLVNCGDTKAVQFILKDFLRAQGVNHLRRVILTEGVKRDCGGLVPLDQLFGVGQIWTSPEHFSSAAFYDAVIGFQSNDRLLSTMQHRIMYAGDTVGCWTALHPGSVGHFTRLDDSALVLMGNFDHTKILLLSDLGMDGQAVLLANHTNDLHADIVISGQPTMGEPLSDGLLAAIQPKLIIIADSAYHTSRRSREETTLQDRLAATGIPTLYTSATGAITITTTQHGWYAQAMNGEGIWSKE